MSIPASALGILAFVFIGGFILPIPHDAVVLLAGYYASASATDSAAAVVASVIAVLAADMLMYGVSRLGGPLFGMIAARLPAETREAFTARFLAHAGWTIFLARFVMGVRLAVPVVSGSTKYPWHRFFFFDAAAVVIYVPAFFFFGYLFHNRIAAAIRDLTATEHAIIAASLAACAVVVAAFVGQRYRRRRAKKAALARGRH